MGKNKVKIKFYKEMKLPGLDSYDFWIEGGIEKIKLQPFKLEDYEKSMFKYSFHFPETFDYDLNKTYITATYPMTCSSTYFIGEIIEDGVKNEKR